MVSPARHSLAGHSLAALFSALLAICLCFAAPSLARADAGSPATDGNANGSADGNAGASADASAGAIADDATSPHASSAQDDDLVAYSLGGVQIGLPDEGLEIVALGDIALISNDDASLVVTILPMTSQSDLPATDQELHDYFGAIAQAAVEAVDVAVSSGSTYTMVDGETAYLYLLSYEANGVSVESGMYFVPLSSTDYTLVQITFSKNSTEAAALANLISPTVALATPEAIPLDSLSDGVELTQQVEAGGLTLGLPEDFALDEKSAADKPSWYNEDGTVMLSVMPGLVNGISALGVEAFDLIAEGIAANLEGHIEGTTLVANDGAEVYTYMFTFSSGSVEFLGALGMVTLTDDTVTGILTLAPIEKSEAVNAITTAIFESVRLA